MVPVWVASIKCVFDTPIETRVSELHTQVSFWYSCIKYPHLRPHFKAFFKIGRAAELIQWNSYATASAYPALYLRFNIYILFYTSYIFIYSINTKLLGTLLRRGYTHRFNARLYACAKNSILNYEFTMLSDLFWIVYDKFKISKAAQLYLLPIQFKGRIYPAKILCVYIQHLWSFKKISENITYSILPGV